MRLDGGTQPRAALNHETIAEYGDCMKDGQVFPPVVVFYDGEHYWLADGFHRWHAAKQAGLKELRCDIIQGSQRSAVLYSVGVNAAHGLRRTNEDKQRAVLTLLNDEEWREWSDNAIAKHCAVHQTFVSRMHRSLRTNLSDTRTYTTKHGTIAVMNTAAIGKNNGNGHGQPAAPVVVSDPPAPARIITSAELTAEFSAPPAGEQPDWWQSSATDDWHTPQWLFDLARKEFKFTLDVCATAKNAKCKRYFTRRDNGLEQTWRGVCWMNPPYGREIGAWIEKAHQSAKDGATVACLVPARTDTAWWWDYCTRGEIRFLRGRLQFSNADNGAPFPSALVIFHPGVPKRNAKTIWWEASEP